MATRQPRARKEKGKTASALLDALKFINIAQDSEGSAFQTHCRIHGGTLIASNGGITAGIYIDEAMSCAPHTKTFIAALEKCNDAIAMTLLDSGRLSVKSGKFRAQVPCVPIGDLQPPQPDAPVANLTDAVKAALAACIAVAKDGEAPPACGVLLKANTAVATDRHVVIEAWHGIDLPPVFLPRVSAAAIANSSKPLKSFGFSDTSATFFFEDDSFIKTALFENNFPDYEKFINAETSPYPLPGGFYEAIEALKPFCDQYVYFNDNRAMSHKEEKEATTYEIEGVPTKTAMNIAQLQLVRAYMSDVQFKVGPREMTYFFSADKMVRGCIAQIHYGET